MSLFIGLPNLDISDARIEVYPDHIEFGSTQWATGGVSVYLTLREMAELSKTLAKVSARPDGIQTVLDSSHDECTDAVGDLLHDWVDGRAPGMQEDESLEKAAEVMRLVLSRLDVRPKGSVGAEQLS